MFVILWFGGFWLQTDYKVNSTKRDVLRCAHNFAISHYKIILILSLTNISFLQIP